MGRKIAKVKQQNPAKGLLSGIASLNLLNWLIAKKSTGKFLITKRKTRPVKTYSACLM
jgi:hypothetical protein